MPHLINPSAQTGAFTSLPQSPTSVGFGRDQFTNYSSTRAGPPTSTANSTSATRHITIGIAIDSYSYKKQTTGKLNTFASALRGEKVILKPGDDLISPSSSALNVMPSSFRNKLVNAERICGNATDAVEDTNFEVKGVPDPDESSFDLTSDKSGETGHFAPCASLCNVVPLNDDEVRTRCKSTPSEMPVIHTSGTDLTNNNDNFGVCASTILDHVRSEKRLDADVLVKKRKVQAPDGVHSRKKLKVIEDAVSDSEGTSACSTELTQKNGSKVSPNKVTSVMDLGIKRGFEKYPLLPAEIQVLVVKNAARGGSKRVVRIVDGLTTLGYVAHGQNGMLYANRVINTEMLEEFATYFDTPGENPSFNLGYKDNIMFLDPSKQGMSEHDMKEVLSFICHAEPVRVKECHKLYIGWYGGKRSWVSKAFDLNFMRALADKENHFDHIKEVSVISYERCDLDEHDRHNICGFHRSISRPDEADVPHLIVTACLRKFLLYLRQRKGSTVCWTPAVNTGNDQFFCGGKRDLKWRNQSRRLAVEKEDRMIAAEALLALFASH